MLRRETSGMSLQISSAGPGGIRLKARSIRAPRSPGPWGRTRQPAGQRCWRAAASGVTASHGTVSEPCNHLQKFPHPQLLLLHYLQGSTALEAYWKSVAWPQQSLFVGDPLAAPFSAARRAAATGPAPAPGPR